MLMVRRTPRFPKLKWKPFEPTVVLTPPLLKLSFTPGATLIVLRKRIGMVAPIFWPATAAASASHRGFDGLECVGQPVRCDSSRESVHRAAKLNVLSPKSLPAQVQPAPAYFWYYARSYRSDAAGLVRECFLAPFASTHIDDAASEF